MRRTLFVLMLLWGRAVRPGAKTADQGMFMSDESWLETCALHAIWSLQIERERPF